MSLSACICPVSLFSSHSRPIIFSYALQSRWKARCCVCNLIFGLLILQLSKLNPTPSMGLLAEHAWSYTNPSGYLYVRFAGRVAEYDTPARLLEDKSSMFLKLVSEYSSRSSGVPDFWYQSSVWGSVLSMSTHSPLHLLSFTSSCYWWSIRLKSWWQVTDHLDCSPTPTRTMPSLGVTVWVSPSEAESVQ